MTAPEALSPQSAASLRERAGAGDPEPPPLGYSTLPPRNSVDISTVLHRQDTRPAASLSTDPLRDGATHYARRNEP